MKCGFCRLTTGCGQSRCFHFEGTQEGFLRFSGPDQKIAGVRALSSLRTVLSGECIYRLAGQEYRLTAGDCIVLNADDEFDLYLKQANTDLLTVCFDKDRTQEVLANESASDECLIDAPLQHTPQPIQFPRRVFQQDPTTASILRALDPGGAADTEQLDLVFSALYRGLLRTHSSEIRSIADLTSKRAPVRVEIHRRLELAQEYIAANLGEKLDTGSIAAVASMSKHHFIRSFKQAYRITPYRHILELRLRAAKSDLETGEASVTAIARRYRFSSIQTFSKAFKHLFGVAPSTIIPHHDIQS